MCKWLQEKKLLCGELKELFYAALNLSFLDICEWVFPQLDPKPDYWVSMDIALKPDQYGSYSPARCRWVLERYSNLDPSDLFGTLQSLKNLGELHDVATWVMNQHFDILATSQHAKNILADWKSRIKHHKRLTFDDYGDSEVFDTYLNRYTCV
jgi:hypothetical protein